MDIAKRYTRRVWFWLLLVLGFFLFLYLIRSILLPFVVGILTAYFLDPAADKLEEWGCSRNVATALITVGFFGLIALSILALAPVVVNQVGGLIEELPNYIRQLRHLAYKHLSVLPFSLELPLNGDKPSLGGSEIGTLQGLGKQLLQSGFVIMNVVSLLVITPVVAFYLLRDWDVLVAHIDRLLPRKHKEVIEEQMRRIDQTLAGFIRGQINVMLILGIFYAIALSLAGLKYAVLVGLLAGLLIIIPYIGTFISGVLSVSIAYVQFEEWWQVGVVASIFVLGQMMEGYFLTPKLVGGKVGLHPAWIIFGMLAGGALFGFVGILLAVPVTAVIGVLVRFAVEQYMESDYYKGT